MFSCCFWWFLLGALVGWILNWLLGRYLTCSRSKCCKNPSNNADTTNTLLETTPPKAVAEVPVTAKPAATKIKAVESEVQKISTPEKPKPFVLDVAAAKAAGFKLKNPNDLTVVEGIGPKISELFNDAGVNSFAELGKQTVPQMQKVLDDAGPRYKLAKPGTWAQQAALAAENKWSELKALQDKLSGGV
jgi:predicted flap endonuclease-1-like 5' DNA nuclease